MANIDFQTVFNTLKTDITGLALTTVKKYKDEAVADALGLVENMKENLRTWTLQLANGKLSRKDYEFLVLAQKELIEMNALRQAGLSLIKADELKNKILNQIVKTVFDLI
jgi:hypothetical protein